MSTSTSSTLLEQAIVDASALKEAAIKNAEASLVERYADDIKEAVTSLLEAPEDDPLGMMGGEKKPLPNPLLLKLPLHMQMEIAFVLAQKTIRK